MSIALIGGTLIDGNGGRPVPDAVVIVEGDRIQRAGPAAQMSTPADATTIDITGRTVMPGLVDAHIHICGEFRFRADASTDPVAQLYSYSGGSRRRKTTRHGVHRVPRHGG